MEVILASNEMVPILRSFFGAHVDLSHDGVYSREFVCPDGIMAATIRGQMLVTLDKQQVVAACRFYRKKNNAVSLYQFAIEQQYRGIGLLFLMLRETRACKATVRCPEGAQFNDYYHKTGWQLQKIEKGFMHWAYSLSD